MQNESDSRQGKCINQRKVALALLRCHYSFLGRTPGEPSRENFLADFDEVEEGGRADKAGIRLGDVLVKINGMETNELSLEQAHDIINKAGNNINLAVSNLEDQEYSDADDYQEISKSFEESLDVTESDGSAHNVPSIEKSAQSNTNRVTGKGNSDSNLDDISQNEEDVSNKEDGGDKKMDIYAALEELEAEEEQPRVDVNSLPLLPPRPAPTPELAQRKSWHPVMLDTNPPPIIEETTGNEEAPHKKLMRDIKQAISQNKAKPSPENKRCKKEPVKVEETAENENKQESEPELNVEQQLRAMQQQLKSLSRLPATIQATLIAVTAKIDGLLPAEQADTPDELTITETSDVDADNEPATEESLDVVSERAESTDVLTEEDRSMKETTPEPEPLELTPDQIEKQERNAKLETLNRSWPWADGYRPVYKIPEHYKVPYSNLISSRVKVLETKVPIKRL